MSRASSRSRTLTYLCLGLQAQIHAGDGQWGAQRATPFLRTIKKCTLFVLLLLCPRIVPPLLIKNLIVVECVRVPPPDHQLFRQLGTNREEGLGKWKIVPPLFQNPGSSPVGLVLVLDRKCLKTVHNTVFTNIHVYF